MPEASDYELLKTPEEPPPARSRSAFAWLLAALFIIAAAVAAYVVFGRRTPAPSAVTVRHTDVAAKTAAQPLGSAPGSLALPPLGESDALIRDLMKQISSHPQVVAWLATEGLIRRFTIDVANVAEGRTPARQLPMLRPASGFRVIGGAEPTLDPRSFARYDSIAAAASSLDPPGIARLYGTLKPRIEEAARELGTAPFDQTLERAIVQLLRTPVVEDPVRLKAKGIGYAFADPTLEHLTPAQKQLLRTGARNQRLLQSSLRAIALELGIPAERLPPPQ